MVLIKEVKQTGGNARITFSKRDLEKIEVKPGEYVKIKKLEEEDE